MIIKDGGGRMEGKLSWLDDRQQLAIKTSQGWREVQVHRNRNLSVLSFKVSVDHCNPPLFHIYFKSNVMVLVVSMLKKAL